MSDERFNSVWEAIEATPAQAENMRLRSALVMSLKDYMARQGLTQSQAANIFGVTQSRISDLLRGKIDVFELDTLVKMFVNTSQEAGRWPIIDASTLTDMEERERYMAWLDAAVERSQADIQAGRTLPIEDVAARLTAKYQCR